MDNGGLEDLEAWCKEHPERRLNWIDTYSPRSARLSVGQNGLMPPNKAIEALQKLAGEYQVGIVLNHHLRKMSSEDEHLMTSAARWGSLALPTQ
jgi:hypothetical protein